MRIVGAIRLQDRPAFVFEDGSIALLVGMRDAGSPDSSTPPEPVMLIRPPVPVVAAIPEGKRIAATRPKLFPEVLPFFSTGKSGKTTMLDDDD